MLESQVVRTGNFLWIFNHNIFMLPLKRVDLFVNPLVSTIQHGRLLLTILHGTTRNTEGTMGHTLGKSGSQPL